MLTNEDLARDKATCEVRITTDPEFTGFYTRIMSAIDELLALREAVAPQMAEVDALEAGWQGMAFPNADPVKHACEKLRTAILACEKEKQRADEAEKESRKVECCTCGHEMVEVDGQFGCEHCDHEYDETCVCWRCEHSREHEGMKSKIAALTAERDEVVGLLKWWFTDNMERITEYAGLVSGEDRRNARRILEIVEGK